MKKVSQYSETMVEQHKKSFKDEIIKSIFDMMEDEDSLSLDIRINKASRLTHIEVSEEDEKPCLIISEEYLDIDELLYERHIYLGTDRISRSDYDDLSLDMLYALWSYLKEK